MGERLEGAPVLGAAGADLKKRDVQFVIVAPDQTVEEAGVDSPETSDEILVVNSPVTEGIAMIRAPLKGPSRAARAEEALKATSCGPYTKSG